jgi:two-component system phosphate regulon sensor histidine kinase PhoR
MPVWNILLGVSFGIATIGLVVIYLRQRRRAEVVGRVLAAIAEERDVTEVLGLLSEDDADWISPRRVETLVLRAKEMRDRIERDEFNIRNVLSSMEEGLLVVDERMTVLISNPAFVRLVGGRGDISGHSVHEVFRSPEFLDLICAALSDGESRSEVISWTFGEMERALHVGVMRTVDQNGAPAALAVLRDVTRLQALEAMRRDFVSNVSHELRTPLAIFQGYVELLREGEGLPLEERNKALDVLDRTSRRLNALVQDLLMIARLESGTEKQNPERINVQKFLNEVAQDWELKAREQGFVLAVEVATECVILADVHRLLQIYNNLIDNASRYIPAQGGAVRLSATLHEGVVEMRVIDNGGGIAPADLPRVFERFYKADRSRTAVNGHRSTGLGLSIVKHLVFANGGQVHAESELGVGTQIVLRFPAAG